MVRVTVDSDALRLGRAAFPTLGPLGPGCLDSQSRTAGGRPMQLWLSAPWGWGWAQGKEAWVRREEPWRGGGGVACWTTARPARAACRPTPGVEVI